MNYDIYYKPSAVKELEVLPTAAQKKIMEVVMALGQGDFYKVEKLQGHAHSYRSKRAWPYRILFVLEGKVIRITNIVHRQGAYR